MQVNQGFIRYIFGHSHYPFLMQLNPRRPSNRSAKAGDWSRASPGITIRSKRWWLPQGPLL